MPTATKELRDWAIKHFGDIDCGLIEKELKTRGFDLTDTYTWKRSRQPNNFEWNCIYFLIEEWDYNGYED